MADDRWLLMLWESWTIEPNGVGTATFQQYFSAGHNKRSSGILTTANNLVVRVNLWTKHNYQSGELEERKSGISEIIVLQRREVLCGDQFSFNRTPMHMPQHETKWKFYHARKSKLPTPSI